MNVPTLSTFHSPNSVNTTPLLLPDNNTEERVAYEQPSPTVWARKFFVAYDSVDTLIFVEFDFVV